jgi:hypothetical protein
LTEELRLSNFADSSIRIDETKSEKAHNLIPHLYHQRLTKNQFLEQLCHCTHKDKSVPFSSCTEENDNKYINRSSSAVNTFGVFIPSKLYPKSKYPPSHQIQIQAFGKTAASTATSKRCGLKNLWLFTHPVGRLNLLLIR